MSILDFTTGLFREPANLRSFVDDPDQALEDAGLPDATPDQVHDLLPVVAESMPPDHPLQRDLVEEGEKGFGDLFAPQIEEGDPEPADDYPPSTTIASTSISALSLGARLSNDVAVLKLDLRPLPSGGQPR